MFSSFSSSSPSSSSSSSSSGTFKMHWQLALREGSRHRPSNSDVPPFKSTILPTLNAVAAVATSTASASASASTLADAALRTPSMNVSHHRHHVHDIVRNTIPRRTLRFFERFTTRTRDIKCFFTSDQPLLLLPMLVGIHIMYDLTGKWNSSILFYK